MKFFQRSFCGEVIINKTFGRPFFVARNWSLIPFPCCISTSRFRVAECKFDFETDEVQTKDEKYVTILVTIKCFLDTSSRSKIMKAYKNFADSMNQSNGSNVRLDIKYAVYDVIRDCITKQVSKMTLDEMIKFNWIFNDSLFTQCKYVLLENHVHLENLGVQEIKEITKQPVPYSYEEENIYEIEMCTVDSKNALDNKQVTEILLSSTEVKNIGKNEFSRQPSSSSSDEVSYFHQDSDSDGEVKMLLGLSETSIAGEKRHLYSEPKENNGNILCRE